MNAKKCIVLLLTAVFAKECTERSQAGLHEKNFE